MNCWRLRRRTNSARRRDDSMRAWIYSIVWEELTPVAPAMSAATFPASSPAFSREAICSTEGLSASIDSLVNVSASATRAGENGGGVAAGAAGSGAACGAMEEGEGIPRQRRYCTIFVMMKIGATTREIRPSQPTARVMSVIFQKVLCTHDLQRLPTSFLWKRRTTAPMFW